MTRAIIMAAVLGLGGCANVGPLATPSGNPEITVPNIEAHGKARPAQADSFKFSGDALPAVRRRWNDGGVAGGWGLGSSEVKRFMVKKTDDVCEQWAASLVKSAAFRAALDKIAADLDLAALVKNGALR